MRSVTKSRGTASADALPASEKSVSRTVIFSRLEVEQLLMKRQRVLKRSPDVGDDERLCRLQVDDADVVRLGRGELRVAGRAYVNVSGRDQERDRQVALPGTGRRGELGVIGRLVFVTSLPRPHSGRPCRGERHSRCVIRDANITRSGWARTAPSASLARMAATTSGDTSARRNAGLASSAAASASC